MLAYHNDTKLTANKFRVSKSLVSQIIRKELWV